MKPLTVGNIVSAGLQIYRDRFFDYYKLALVGYLWIFVPIYILGGLIFFLNLQVGDSELFLLIFFLVFIFIYCIAKYSARLGLISRLAFGEVTAKLEPIRDAKRSVKPKMWKFLIAGILSNLIIVAASFVFLIVLSIVIGIFLGIFLGIFWAIVGFNPAVGQDFDIGNFDIGMIITIIIFYLIIIISFLFFLTWLISRLLMVETSLAIEENINATDAISRSWKLTKGSIGFVFRLQSIILVGILISLPIILVIQMTSLLVVFVLGIIASYSPELSSLLSSLFSIAITIAGGALLIPFWQSLKAVIYYDLRVRKEGLGLNLEES